MQFTTDISAGTLIAACSLGLGLWRVYSANQRNIARMHSANQERLGVIENEIKNLKQWYLAWVNRQMHGPMQGGD